MVDRYDDSQNLRELLAMIKELIDEKGVGILEKDPILRKEIWHIINYKLGIDSKTIGEISNEFDFRYGNYQRLYAAIEEQMEFMDQIKNKRQ